MIDLYQYEYAGRVCLIDVNGKEWIGEACDMTDSEDQSDLCKSEDSLTIMTDDGKYVDFYASEVKNIEVIEKK